MIRINEPSDWFGLIAGCILCGYVAVVFLPGLVGCLCQLLRTRFLLANKAITPDFTRLNPVNGATRMCRSLKVSLGNFLLLPALVFFIPVFTIWIVRQGIALWLMPHAVREHALIGCVAVLWIIGCCAIALIGLVELLLERLRFNKENGMTHEELKQELKEDEGSPEVKAHRRNMHEQLLFAEMGARVRRSRFVVVARNNRSGGKATKSL